jgi:hypothetical protein
LRPSFDLGFDLQAIEEKVDHPNRRSLPALARPNVCHASEGAQQIVRLDVVSKDTSLNPTRDQRFNRSV